jgi:hypothetical protein
MLFRVLGHSPSLSTNHQDGSSHYSIEDGIPSEKNTVINVLSTLDVIRYTELGLFYFIFNL